MEEAEASEENGDRIQQDGSRAALPHQQSMTLTDEESVTSANHLFVSNNNQQPHQSSMTTAQEKKPPTQPFRMVEQDDHERMSMLPPDSMDNSKAYSMPAITNQNPEDSDEDVHGNDDGDCGTVEVGDYGTEQDIELINDDDDDEEGEGDEGGEEEYDEEDARTIMEVVEGELANFTEFEQDEDEEEEGGG